MELFKEQSITTLFAHAYEEVANTINQLPPFRIESIDYKEIAKRHTIKYDLKFELDRVENEIKFAKNDAMSPPVLNIEYSFIVNETTLLTYFTPRGKMKNTNGAEIKSSNHFIISIPTEIYEPTLDLDSATIEFARKQVTNIFNNIKENVESIKQECDEFDQELYTYTLDLIEKRKQEINQEKDLLTRLNPFK